MANDPSLSVEQTFELLVAKIIMLWARIDYEIESHMNMLATVAAWKLYDRNEELGRPGTITERTLAKRLTHYRRGMVWLHGDKTPPVVEFDAWATELRSLDGIRASLAHGFSEIDATKPKLVSNFYYSTQTEAGAQHNRRPATIEHTVGSLTSTVHKLSRLYSWIDAHTESVTSEYLKLFNIQPDNQSAKSMVVRGSRHSATLAVSPKSKETKKP